MDEREFNYINAIPLIDVMLVLLTITLTTASFISQGAIKINLPTVSSQIERDPVVVNVFMTVDRKIFVETNEVGEEDFEQALLKYDHKKTTVVVSADRALTIEALTNILGHIQNAGFANISIKTELPLK